jgi:hypothetical protein
MKRVGEYTASKTDWIRRASLRLLSRNQEISAWDAVVIATAVAQVCAWTDTPPEAAIDAAFECSAFVTNRPDSHPTESTARH